jgi:hypothetical protein
MFLSQSRMNSVILYCVIADFVLGYVLKKYQGPNTTGFLVILYALNILVLLAVYRFWKLPVFEWNEAGFVFYGISPFKRDRGAWQKVAKAGFREIEEKKGRKREYLIIVYAGPTGASRTGLVPMDMVGFRDRLKEELQGFLKDKGVSAV